MISAARRQSTVVGRRGRHTSSAASTANSVGRDLDEVGSPVAAVVPVVTTVRRRSPLDVL